MARVVLEALTKQYVGERGEVIQAVAQANLIIEDRELMVLVGPSGCGKTTTLRLIAGLEQPSSGKLLIDGVLVNPIAPKDRDVGMVFQNYALYPHMSVYENLAYGLKLRRFGKGEIAARVGEIASMLNLTRHLERQPRELSGGERQRVALGRALARRPKVLLLDEPLSGLDPRLREQMRGEIARLQLQLGLTMLYVTHDQTEAFCLGQRVVVMNAGVMEQVGEPMHLYHLPKNRFVAEFFGSPPMNFFKGTLAANGNGLMFVEQPSSLRQAEAEPFSLSLDAQFVPRLRGQLGESLVLGIRAEHIALCKQSEPYPVHAIVERIERLGAETRLHVSSAGHRFVTRLQEPDALMLKQQVALAFQMEQAHFFHPVTGKAF